MIEISAAVEELSSPDSFDVLEFVNSAILPQDDVTIYTDGDAALKLAKIFVAEAARQKQAEEEAIGLDEEYEDYADEDEITALHERLAASALVFHLQGLAPAATEAIEKHLKATLPYTEGAVNEEFNETFNNTLIAKTIVSVEKSDGKVNTQTWTPEGVAALNTSLYVSEQNKLFNAAAELNYIGAIFDRAINADFS